MAARLMARDGWEGPGGGAVEVTRRRVWGMWHGLASGDLSGRHQHHRWSRMAAFLRAWRPAFIVPIDDHHHQLRQKHGGAGGVPSLVALLPSLRAVLVPSSSSTSRHAPPPPSEGEGQGEGEVGGGAAVRPQQVSSSPEARLAASELLGEVVVTLLQGTPPPPRAEEDGEEGAEEGGEDDEGGKQARSIDGDGQREAYRSAVRRVVERSATGGCGVLETLTAALRAQVETGNDSDPSGLGLAELALALAHVVTVIGADEQLRREQLSAPSDMLKATKFLIRRLHQLATASHDVPAALARTVQGVMHCLRALGGTARPQCSVVENACVALLDSPHKDVRQAVAECLSVRIWCGGMGEWSGLVGTLIATIHRLLDSPPSDEHMRKSLPPSFTLGPPSTRDMASYRSFSTLIKALRFTLAGTFKSRSAVPVPIPHLVDLLCRILSLSPLSVHFDNTNRSTLVLWTTLPYIHKNAYRLLSSIIACVGKHLLPHYVTINRILIHGLERISSQLLEIAAWSSTLSALLESMALAFTVLAPCLWKNSSTLFLSQVLPLLLSPTLPRTTVERTLRLNAMKVVGAVVRHAGPLLSSFHTIEIHRAILRAAHMNISQEFQEEALRILSDCSLLPQAASMLPATLQSLEEVIQLRSNIANESSYRAVQACELLIHPRVLPRVRLVPPHIPTPVEMSEAVPLYRANSAPSRTRLATSSVATSHVSPSSSSDAIPSHEPSPTLALSSVESSFHSKRIGPYSAETDNKRQRKEPPAADETSSAPLSLAASILTALPVAQSENDTGTLPVSPMEPTLAVVTKPIQDDKPEPLQNIPPMPLPLPRQPSAKDNADEDEIADIIAEDPDTSDAESDEMDPDEIDHDEMDR